MLYEVITGLRVLNLPLKRAFNVDLGFRLGGPRHELRMGEAADTDAVQPGDRALLQALTEGLEITAAVITSYSIHYTKLYEHRLGMAHQPRAGDPGVHVDGNQHVERAPGITDRARNLPRRSRNNFV